MRTLVCYKESSVNRACRKTLLKVMGGFLPSLLPLDDYRVVGALCPDVLSAHLSARSKSRISLLRLKERIDRGPAISSVCHRRSLGLLNP
jgi:hypothetical protein